MSVSIGGIDLASSAINAELRIGVLEKIVEKLVQHAPPNVLTQKDIELMREQTFEELKNKYPNAGLSINET